MQTNPDHLQFGCSKQESRERKGTERKGKGKGKGKGQGKGRLFVDFDFLLLVHYGGNKVIYSNRFVCFAQFVFLETVPDVVYF